MDPKEIPNGLSSVVDNLKTTCQGGECNLFSKVIDEKLSKISKISKASKSSKNMTNNAPRVKDIMGGSDEDLIFGFPRRLVFIVLIISFVILMYLWLKKRDYKRLQNINNNLDSTTGSVARPPAPKPKVPDPVVTPTQPIVRPVITKRPPPPKRPTMLRKPPGQNPLAGKRVVAATKQPPHPNRSPQPSSRPPQPPPEDDFTYLKDL